MQTLSIRIARDNHFGIQNGPYRQGTNPSNIRNCSSTWSRQRERERELRREGGKSLLAYVKGVDPHLIHIDRPTTIRSPEHISGWVNYPPAYVIWVDGCVARTAGRGDVPYDV